MPRDARHQTADQPDPRHTPPWDASPPTRLSPRARRLRGSPNQTATRTRLALCAWTGSDQTCAASFVQLPLAVAAETLSRRPTSCTSRRAVRLSGSSGEEAGGSWLRLDFGSARNGYGCNACRVCAIARNVGRRLVTDVTRF